MIKKVENFNEAAEAIEEVKTWMRWFGGELPLNSKYASIFKKMLKKAEYRERMALLAYLECKAETDDGSGYYDWSMVEAQEYATAREFAVLETEKNSGGLLTIKETFDESGNPTCLVVPGSGYLSYIDPPDYVDTEDRLCDEVRTECEDIMAMLAHSLNPWVAQDLHTELQENERLRVFLMSLIHAESRAVFDCESRGFCTYPLARRVIEARARASAAISYYSEGKLELYGLPFSTVRWDSNALFVANRSEIGSVDVAPEESTNFC